MRKRNVHIQFWLDEKEAERFAKKVKKSGISREAYLRHLIDGNLPREYPPPDYFRFMQELYRVGNNLNQIAQKAHVLNVVDVKRYDEACHNIDKLILDITKAVIFPAKRKD